MARPNPTARLWDCTNTEYHAEHTLIGRSMLTDFIEDPALFHGRYVTKTLPLKKKTAALEIGSVFHDIIAEPRITVSRAGYAENTIAVWRRCERPKGKPTSASKKSSSRYWALKDGVVREADHWGVVGSCFWALEDAVPGEQSTAYCPWQDFLVTRSFLPIPVDVLDAKGARSGGKWKEFEAANAGQILLKADEYGLLPKLLGAVQAEPAARAIVDQSTARERGIVWNDAKTGIQRKCRIDLWPGHNRFIGDFKTSSSTDLRSFAYDVLNYGYDLQAEWYLDGVEAVTGERPAFYFIVCRKEPPYTCFVTTLSQDYHERARRKIDNALARMAECQRTGNWKPPTYNKVVTLEMPRSAKWEDEYDLVS